MTQLKIHLKDWSFIICALPAAFFLVATCSGVAAETNKVPHGFTD